MTGSGRPDFEGPLRSVPAYAGPVARPTKAQIDEEILDAAAALFARHGFEQTSLQRIADSVGYSKTGLLHRFPTKEALIEATTASTALRLEGVAEAVDHLPTGAARDLAVLTELTTVAQSRPGSVALVLSVLSADSPSALGRDLERIGEVVFRAFGTPLADDHDTTTGTTAHTTTGTTTGTTQIATERALRITVAVGGLAVASLAFRDEPHELVRPRLVRAAFDALGHHHTPEEN